MQQATVNLLADMGAQPATLQAPVVVGDGERPTRTAPTSTITSPPAGATIAAGAPVTITGTASDAAAAWSAASRCRSTAARRGAARPGRRTGRYTWMPGVLGAGDDHEPRATDDSLNIERPSVACR